MLAITNPMLKRMLLEHLVEHMDQGGFDALLTAGFTPEFLDSLRHRPARDLINIAQTELDIRVALPQRAIAACLQRLDWQRRDAHLREYFIRHGASRQMVCQFFKLTADEFRDLRELLVPDGVPSGRPSMPSERLRDEIHRVWHEMERSGEHPTLRERIYALHQRFPDLRIQALHATVTEFDEDVATVGGSVGASSSNFGSL
ncbi:STY4526/YPO1902 family pathogenicity island replication protein [Acidovorax sp. SUPP2825]|uniref:STY4526/YPO1902 family pathogenicity island replication protein n=1 Tax=Acidovorax sp. SUPP2825 TaxID=2920879 RepID=UPI0023DE2123|nr:STY4526/YPO1902 family pathogenicity island replication protein [Acidovorax sp. SUPP2825]GKS96788.1 DUF2857 family protein [Acidovorax sp. SUPP2825]